MRTTLALLTLAGLATPALAAPPELVAGIVSHFDAAHPRVQVPGQPGVQFVNTLFGTRASGSNLWAFTMSTNTGVTATANTVVSGNGLTLSNVLQSGVTEYAPGLFITGIGATVPRFNAVGDWTVAFGSGSTGAVVKSIAGVPQLAVNAATPVTAIGDSFYTGTFSSPNINGSGDVSFLASLSTNVGISEAGFLLSGSSAPLIVPTTVPTNQASSGTEVMADIDAFSFQTSAAGTNWLALGELTTNNTGSKVLVVNGSVVLQQGQPVPGLPGSTLASIATSASNPTALMNSNGSWIARGTATSGPDFIIRDGSILATAGTGTLGSLITPTSTERWLSFSDVRVNDRGDYVIFGRTTTADTLTRDVLVVNGKRVVARLSDALDTTNTGVPSTTHYLSQFDFGRIAYSNDNYIYFSTRLKASATATVNINLLGTTANNNASLVRVSWCDADIAGANQSTNIDGALTADDIIVFLSYYFASNPRADVAGPNQSTTVDGQFTADDIIVYLSKYFAGC